MPLLTTVELTKRYPGGVTALDGLNLELEPGIIDWSAPTGPARAPSSRSFSACSRPPADRSPCSVSTPRTAGPNCDSFSANIPEFDCLPLDQTAADLETHMAPRVGASRHGGAERAAEMLRQCGTL